MNKWVFYHAECMDGYAAAWAAWKAFGNKASYKPVRHHMPMPTFPEGAELYILDFCYPLDVLLAAAQRASKIVVLDHHISAQKEFEAHEKQAALPSNLEVNFIQAHSGCMIAWQYFQGDLEPPVLLLHIEDHDLWRHKLPKTEAISKALYMHLPLNFAAFEKIKLPTLEREGVVLLKQQKLNVSRLLKTRHKVTLNNIAGLAVNAPAMFSSDLGHELAELSGTFGLTYSYHGQRQCYDCGLRSISEFNVAELAQHFGGGGHKNASGFRVDQATFLSFM
ncbi:MAG: DHH family phosphoesterase [Methyloprofundus sp.]|nr:DHH family phosphoesterase [Methyloprofundus sp.]MDT8425028.1 DHH family phosphoesterase [Methyloprofundus sp.]